MTTNERVEATLSASGVPVMRLTWGPYAPHFPYATYEERPQSVFADNMSTVRLPHYTAYLHTKEADEGLCDAFTGRIAEMGTYIRHPTEIEDGHFVHRFDFTVTRRAE